MKKSLTLFAEKYVLSYLAKLSSEIFTLPPNGFFQTNGQKRGKITDGNFEFRVDSLLQKVKFWQINEKKSNYKYLFV